MLDDQHGIEITSTFVKVCMSIADLNYCSLTLLYVELRFKKHTVIRNATVA